MTRVLREAITPHTLAKLSMHDLLVAFEAAHAASDAWLGCINQPRTAEAARDLLNAEWERANGFIDMIVAEAKRRVPQGYDDAATRSRILAQWLAAMGDFEELANVATRAAAVAQARCAEARRGKRGEAA